MSQRPLYTLLASAVVARANCADSNAEWFDRWSDRITNMVREFMPSGSGFDNGTNIDVDRSNADRLMFITAFHHMNEGGFYDGWTYHTVTIRPCLLNGFSVTVSGKNRNDIKEYIAENFDRALRTLTDWKD